MSESPPAGAVFLSYASQDAEAARRVCAALLASGVEVWFDQSELRGGDAWDQRIRQQIKECALFLPIVSANTQRRTEGYFRLEWRLADQRTHLMGRSRPFLVPICVDQTSDSDADVPESFLSVQWTRLPHGETPSAFCERVKALLGGEGYARSSGTAATSGPRTATVSRSGDRKGDLPGRRSLKKNLLVALALMVCAAIAACVFIRKTHSTETASAGPSAGNPPSMGETGNPVADQLVARARAIVANTEYTREGLALAVELAQKATDAAPESAQAWSTRALVEATFVQRGWDQSDQRHQSVKISANTALVLDPKNTDAMLALAINLMLGDPAEAESIARQAIELLPTDARLYRVIGETYLQRGQTERRLEFLKDIARRFPKDPLVAYDLGRAYRDGDRPNYALALENFKRAVQLAGSLPSGDVEIARLLMQMGDLPGADAVLSRLPAAYRSDDRGVAVEMRLGLLERRPERTIEAAAFSSTDIFNDFIFYGPKAWMVALAYHLKGDPASEAHQWKIAESVERKRIAADPLDAKAQACLAVTLVWLGRPEEAKEEMTPVEALVKRSTLVAYFYGGLGDAKRTVEELRSHDASKCYEELLDDPWWDRVRGSPEFTELMGTAKSGGF